MVGAEGPGMTIQRVGLVGCGTMGTKFLDRLRDEFPVTAFDLDEGKLAAAAERGADPARTRRPRSGGPRT